MISNISSNHTIIGTINDIASLAYYPLLLLILTFLPIIVSIIFLIIKVSNKTKILILFFNIIYSLLLPVIAAAIITDFKLKSYVYGIILNDSFIISAFNNIGIFLIVIYYLAGLFMLAYLVVSAIVIVVMIYREIIIKIKIIINLIKIIIEKLLLKLK
jgi:hypothetical protein